MKTRHRLLLILFSLWLLSLSPIILFKWINPPSTPIQIYSALFSHYNGGTFNNWVEIDSLPHFLGQAVLASEDQTFATHNGFDFKSIRKIILSKQQHRRMAGASTISQQVAKNLLLWPGRSWLRKGLEAYYTFWLELLWSKKRILEVYLNIAEFGPEVYGVKAGIKFHFKKKPIKVSRFEAATLAVILPNPKKFKPGYLPERLANRRNRVLKQMGSMPKF